MVSCSYKFSKTNNLQLSRRILKFGPQYTYPFKILRRKTSFLPTIPWIFGMEKLGRIGIFLRGEIMTFSQIYPPHNPKFSPQNSVEIKCIDF